MKKKKKNIKEMLHTHASYQLLYQKDASISEQMLTREYFKMQGFSSFYQAFESNFSAKSWS